MKKIAQVTFRTNRSVLQKLVPGLLPGLLLGLLIFATQLNTAWSAEDNHKAHTDHNMPMMSMDPSDQDKQPDTQATTGSAQGGSAPANARDPHANSGGYKRDPLRRLTLADELMFYSLLVDRLEVVSRDDEMSQVFDLQAWYGFDYDRLVLKSEGTIDDKALQEMSTELLWGHAIATFWDTQLGARYDSNDGPNRSWLAVGIQGLAPYWFELDTTFYVGESFRTSLSIEGEYELLITQKLVFQTRLEGAIFGKSDEKNAIGSGLTDMSLGFRLRYEFWREFAPYLGVEWSKKFGDTKDLVKAANGSTSESLLVAGLRFWF